MNAASQLLRVLAIIGALAAGVLFWLTNGKTETLNAQLAKAKTAAASDKTDEDKKVEDLQTQVTAAAADKDNMQKGLKAALDQADLADQRFKQAKSDLDEAQTALSAKETKLADMNAQVSDLKSKAEAVDGLTGQVAALTAQRNAIQKQLDDMVAQQVKPGRSASTPSTPGTSPAPVVNNTPVAAPTPTQLSSAASAKILQVDIKNGLLVLDVAGDSNVQKDSQLYLKIGSQPLGVVVVRSTSPTMAVCAIASTDTMSLKDFANIVTQGLKVDYQRAL